MLTKQHETWGSFFFFMLQSQHGVLCMLLTRLKTKQQQQQQKKVCLFMSLFKFKMTITSQRLKHWKYIQTLIWKLSLVTSLNLYIDIIVMSIGSKIWITSLFQCLKCEFKILINNPSSIAIINLCWKCVYVRIIIKIICYQWHN